MTYNDDLKETHKRFFIQTFYTEIFTDSLGHQYFYVYLDLLDGRYEAVLHETLEQSRSVHPQFPSPVDTELYRSLYV